MSTTVADPIAALERARAGKISDSAVANIRRWLTEAPFAVPRPARRRHSGREMGRSRRRFLRSSRVRNRRPPRQDVSGRHQRPQRPDDRRERQGLADYVTLAQGCRCRRVVRDRPRHPPQLRRVRRLCAWVLAAAGFKVFLFDGAAVDPPALFRGPPFGCDAGIMITASHNPPADNGFKCYAAIGRPGDPARRHGHHRVRRRRLPTAKSPRSHFDAGLADGSIVLAGPEVDEAFITAVVSESVSHARGLSIVYTPMHGVGETSVAAALRQPDSNKLTSWPLNGRPTATSPTFRARLQSRDPQTLDAAIAEAKATGADLVLASDPDADRIGVAVPVTGDPNGEWTTLDGNQIGVLAHGVRDQGDRGAG